MPYAHSQGVRIHYQIEEAGPALVLQHGFTDSLESWYELGYVEALIASWIGRMDGSSLEEVLPTMTMPCLLYVGEADANYPGVKDCCKYMPNATFFSLPGLNHPKAFMQSNLVLPRITKFLEIVPS